MRLASGKRRCAARKNPAAERVGRLGFGGFSLFCNYNLSPLFKKGEGIQTDGASNDFKTLTFGISVSNF
jgi:hypothetical protein